MLKFSKKRALVILILVIVFSALIGGSFYFGYKKGVENPKVVIVKGVSNIENSEEKNIDFNLFWDAWKVLKEKYVDADKIPNQDLLYGAISGIIGATKDPYSVFMPPSEAKDFSQEISGEFGGIGAEIGLRNGQIIVVSPLKNSPAEKAGLKAGDKILKINDTITVGLTTEEAVKKIRGEKGTAVTLTIARDGWEKQKEISIVRDIIQIPTLDWKMINENGKEDAGGKILYIQLYNFYEKAPLLFYEAVLQSIFHNPRGIILDLRNNPGGYLEASVNIAGWFLNRGDVVVSEKFRSGEIQPFKASGTGLFREIPAIVLINEGSASASEILAGSLRDDRGIKLVGKKSFGKGSVQEVVDFKDNSMVKITIAHWLTPKGQLIEKNGLTPDYEVDLTENDANNKKDPQLEKAAEILRQEISQ